MTLAIECSKPEPMKASSAHHSTTSLAASDRVRAAIHSARQTRALHSTARQNSCGPGGGVLGRGDRWRRGRGPGPVSGPAGVDDAGEARSSRRCCRRARRPARRATSAGARVARHQPCSITIALPVNSSAPANTTSVRAMPNTAAWTSLAAGGAGGDQRCADREQQHDGDADVGAGQRRRRAGSGAARARRRPCRRPAPACSSRAWGWGWAWGPPRVGVGGDRTDGVRRRRWS